MRSTRPPTYVELAYETHYVRHRYDACFCFRLGTNDPVDAPAIGHGADRHYHEPFWPDVL